LAWNFIGMNVTLAIWVGLGGMMAGLAGPLFLGALWRRVTRAAAIWGFLAGAGAFGVLHAGLIDPVWATPGGMARAALVWLHAQAPNPYACTALAEGVGLLATALVSLVTRPLPADHLHRVFG
ncbi:MAG: sodium:pantothenate symporter, partial [Pseudomonadota bacterium]|nr:sodium:pantothenate symporter [Pseudomonadota bacterium]